MSRASEWAKSRLDALLEFREVDGRRPTKCPEVYLTGKGWMYYQVDDLGQPVLSFPASSERIKGEILGDGGISQLLQQAHWIIAVFGDDP